MGIGGPYEGLWVVIGFGEISVDGSLEVDDAAEHAALETLLGQFGEEALDGIEPGSRCRGEVEGEARLSFEPSPHLGMLVRGIVVDDEMEVPVRRGLAIDVVEKADELLMPMTGHALADHLALQ